MGEQNEGPFYQDGLRFSCTRCSLCCRFDSGYVWLSRADVARLSAGLDLPEKTVIDRYCRIVDIAGFKQLSLREQHNMDCIFWVDGACSVYGSRPLQCRSYPFWSHQLADREAWNRAADHCPGMNAGELHSRAGIDRWLENRRLEPALNADSLVE